MKPLTLDGSKAVAKIVNLSGATFAPATLNAISALLAPVVGEAELSRINESLTRQNRRKLALDDVCRVAYVHARSIHENDGYSPYERIKAYCAKNGSDYDNLHVKVATEILLAVEFIQLVGEEDRKKKQCRRYALPADVKSALKM